MLGHIYTCEPPRYFLNSPSTQFLLWEDLPCTSHWLESLLSDCLPKRQSQSTGKMRKRRTVSATSQKGFCGLPVFLQPPLASLYEAALGPTQEPFLKPVTKPFQRLQQALLQVPALHLPVITCPFSLYVGEMYLPSES